MVLLSLGLLAFAPLNLSPEMRSFPEIAALVGTTPTEVRCDPKIAHRMAFISAKAISREGLLRALDLAIVQEGERKVLKSANAELEREWATEIRRLREAQYSRYAQLMIVADEERKNRPEGIEDERFDPSAWRAMYDEGATRDEKLKAIDTHLASEAWMSVNYGGGYRLAPTLAEFPSQIPPELIERGSLTDVLPFSALSERTLTSLAMQYPKLKGGPESFLVRRRVLGRHEMRVTIGIVDPPNVLPPVQVGRLQAFPYLIGSVLSTSSLKAMKNRITRLRKFDTWLAEKRLGEGEGRALVKAYAAEVPEMFASAEERPKPNGAFVPNDSLSKITEVWAKRGHDVIQELDPEGEYGAGGIENGRLHPNSAWSPTVIEGVLVLRPLFRWVNGSRRYPYRALFALEATGESPDSTRRGSTQPPSEAMARYVAHAGPRDRWWTTGYRGWAAQLESLDRAASARRVLELVPLATLEASARVLRDVEAKANPDPYTGRPGQKFPNAIQTWTHRVSDLPPSAQRAILTEMRELGDEETIRAFSPSLSAQLLREAVLEVRVGDSATGYARTVWIRKPGPNIFEGNMLYGR